MLFLLYIAVTFGKELVRYWGPSGRKIYSYLYDVYGNTHASDVGLNFVVLFVKML